MGTKVQVRRDSALNWGIQNPVLADGEIGYDTTSKLLKIGDGITNWESLNEVNPGSLVHMGTWSAASGSYPTSPEKGWYYIVSVAGTVSTVTYSVDDWIVYNGTGWNKVNNQATISIGSNDIDYGWTYTGNNVDVGTRDGAVTGLYIKPDGTNAYFAGTGNDTVYQYTLATPHNISTGTYDSVSFYIGNQETAIGGLFFKPDGTKMYVLGTTSDTIFQYNLATPWNLSTCSYDSISFSIGGQETASSGLYIKDDGTKLFLCGSGNDVVCEYTFGTAWDITTLTYIRNLSIAVGPINTNEMSVVGLSVNPAGDKVYIIGQSINTVQIYSLPTPWSLSGATLSKAIPLVQYYQSNAVFTPAELHINHSTNKAYVVCTSTDRIFEFDINRTDLGEAYGDKFICERDVQINRHAAISGNLGVVGYSRFNGSCYYTGSIYGNVIYANSGSSPAYLFTNTTSSLINIATTQTTGGILMGSTTGTGTMQLGVSTDTQTVEIASGASTSGKTKTVNIGTGGLSGSTTNISLGSSVSGNTSNVSLLGNVTVPTLAVDTNTTGAASTAFVINQGYQKTSTALQLGSTASTAAAGNHSHAGMTPPMMVEITGNYTVSTTGDATIMGDATSASFTVTLPTPTASQVLTIKKVDTTQNTITIHAVSSGKIDNSTNDKVLKGAYEFIVLQSDGTDWWILGDAPTPISTTITVGASGCDYTKIASAVASISSPSASNPYTIIAYGNITETVDSIGWPSYVSLIGVNLVWTIPRKTTSHTTTLVFDIGICNVKWKDVEIHVTGSAPTYSCYCIGLWGPEDSIVFDNVTVYDETTSSLSSACTIWSCNPTLINCSMYGSTSNWGDAIEITGNASPTLTDCLAVAGDANNGYAIIIDSGTSPTFINCTAVYGYNSGQALAYYVARYASPHLKGCIGRGPLVNYYDDYTGSTSYTALPVASKQYSLNKFDLYIATAGGAGSTLSIGTTVGGSDIASAISCSTTGWKTVTLASPPPIFAANAPIYFTSSSSTAVFRIYVEVGPFLGESLAACTNDSIKNPLFEECTFIGGYNASGISLSTDAHTGQSKYRNCHFSSFGKAPSSSTPAYAAFIWDVVDATNCTISGQTYSSSRLEGFITKYIDSDPAMVPMCAVDLATYPGRSLGVTGSDNTTSWFYKGSDGLLRLYNGEGYTAIGDSATNVVYHFLDVFTDHQIALNPSLVRNQLRFIAPTIQEESTDGSTWTASTRLTSTQLKQLMIGNGRGILYYNIYPVIPITALGQSGYYRLTWEATVEGFYVWLSNLFVDLTTSGNDISILIEGYSSTGWETFASGDSVSGWPNHIYVTHDTKSFRTNYASYPGTYGKLRITLSLVNASVSNEATCLSSVSWYGGYPFGSSDVMEWDGDKNATFPANMNIPTGNTYNINGTPHSHTITEAQVESAITGSGTSATLDHGSATQTNYIVYKAITDTGFGGITKGGSTYSASYGGSGALVIHNSETKPIGFYQNAVKKLEIDTNGNINTVPPLVNIGTNVTKYTNVYMKQMTDSDYGTIVIELPVGYVDVYVYAVVKYQLGNTATIFNISGDITTTQWGQISAMVIEATSDSISYYSNVRAGYYNSKACILIGASFCGWGFGFVTIDEIVLTKKGTSSAWSTNWGTGYNITFQTEESSIAGIINASVIQRYQPKSTYAPPAIWGNGAPPDPTGYADGQIYIQY